MRLFRRGHKSPNSPSIRSTRLLFSEGIVVDGFEAARYHQHAMTMLSSPRTGLSRLALTAALATLAATGSALAGGFGGPPPFTSGSPLITGVDGSYQATARAKNLTGIFRFQYSGGSQTSSTLQNRWVFFIAGQVQRGTVVANVGNGSVTGVLDSLSAGTGTNSNGTVELPIVLLNANNAATGEFSGKMDMNSPNASFSGKGKISPSPASTNQVIGISQVGGNFSISSGGGFTQLPVPGAIIVNTNSFTTAAGTIPETVFNFQGVRTSTSVSNAGGSSGTTSAQ